MAMKKVAEFVESWKGKGDEKLPTGYYNMFDSSTVGVNIYVPSASIKAYQSAATWSKYASNIKGYSFE